MLQIFKIIILKKTNQSVKKICSLQTTLYMYEPKTMLKLVLELLPYHSMINYVQTKQTLNQDKYVTV